jgi:hypothetical protein
MDTTPRTILIRQHILERLTIGGDLDNDSGARGTRLEVVCFAIRLV